MFHVLQYFHHAYLVRTINDAFSKGDIKIPVDDFSTETYSILPPPIYRQAGSTRKRQIVDVERGPKRFKSRGEDQPRSRVQVEKPENAVVGLAGSICEDDDTDAINAFFNSQLAAKSTTKRVQYRCSRCGTADHNASTCTSTGQDVEESGKSICAGEYVVGSCPLLNCGVESTSLD